MFKTEKAAKNYNEIFEEYPIHNYGAQHLAEIAEEGKTAIDLGSGTGTLSRKLQNKFDQVIAVDTSKEMLKHIDEEISRIQIPASYVNSLDITPDLVTANYSFHYFEEPVKLANSIHDMLEENGSFIAEDSSLERWASKNPISNIFDLTEEETIFSTENVISNSKFETYDIDQREFMLESSEIKKLIEGIYYFSDPTQEIEKIRKQTDEKLSDLDENEKLEFQHRAVIARKN